MVAAMLGTPLMEWQQYVADVLLEIDPDTGELAYTDWVLTVPRQSGKSTLILAKASHRCSATSFFGSDQHLAYAAQTQKKATEKFEVDYQAAIKRAPRLKARIRTGNVKVDIRYPNGSVFGVESGTEKSGHGSVLDEGYVDEAFSQVDNRLEQAFEPAMMTRRNRQLGAVSTAGWTDASPYLLTKVQVGRSLVERDVRVGSAYFEWSAPEDAEPGDESVWLACMPAVHRPECPDDCTRHTIRLSAIRAVYDKAVAENKVTEFCRAYLNQWKRKPREGEETALGNWLACSVDLPKEFAPRVESLAVALTKDRSHASIVACGSFPHGAAFVAPVERRQGVDWLAGVAAGLSRDTGVAVVVLVTGPAGDAVADDIEEAGGVVVRAKLADYVAACDLIYDRVQDKTLLQSGHPDLADQVQGARWRTVGDGRRVFGHRASTGAIDMVESAALALWGSEQSAGFNIW